MIRGLDVSAVQGVVDWPSVAAMGCRFAIVKCAEGNRRTADAQFDRNVQGARDAGLVVGCYNFAYPLPSTPGSTGRSPAAQAQQHFELARGLGSQGGDLPPAVDLEWPAPEDWQKWGCSAQQIRGWALDHLAEVERLWGVTPLLYTYPDFWVHLAAAGIAEFARYPLWMASYTATDWPTGGGPLIPHPWTRWAMWQWAGGGTHKLPNGVPVDLDVFNGDDLGALTARAPASMPTPAVVPPEVGPPTPPEDLEPAG